MVKPILSNFFALFRKPRTSANLLISAAAMCESRSEARQTQCEHNVYICLSHNEGQHQFLPRSNQISSVHACHPKSPLKCVTGSAHLHSLLPQKSMPASNCLRTTSLSHVADDSHCSHCNSKINIIHNKDSSMIATSKP
jgi:hypothetical protein